jgi:hypothetical protein
VDEASTAVDTEDSTLFDESETEKKVFQKTRVANARRDAPRLANRDLIPLGARRSALRGRMKSRRSESDGAKKRVAEKCVSLVWAISLRGNKKHEEEICAVAATAPPTRGRERARG